MRIFRIKNDVENFQSVGLVDQTLWSTGLLTFDCTQKVPWESIKCYVQNPNIQKGNFIYLCPGLLLSDQDAFEGMDDILEIAGQILPFEVGTERLFGLNVLQCSNALDVENTTWIRSVSGSRGRIDEYAFHADRLLESSVFKIPETSRSQLLAFEGVKDREDEFIGRYQELRLTGLTFEELWQG